MKHSRNLTVQLLKIVFHPRRTRNKTRGKMFFGVPLILGGCISAGMPPGSWPEPVLADLDGCPNLSGTYENKGVNAKGDKAIPLALLVLPAANRNWTSSQANIRDKARNASHVRFYGPGQSGMKIEVWRDKDLIEAIERGGGLGDGFSCEGGALRVSLPVTGEAVSGVFFDTFKSAVALKSFMHALSVRLDFSACSGISPAIQS